MSPPVRIVAEHPAYDSHMRFAVVVGLLLASATGASAQAPGLTPPSPTEVVVRDAKSAEAATLLTGLGIGVPALMFTVGMTTDVDEGGFAALGLTLGWITPAAGHWYSRHAGTYGILARLGGVSLFFAGLEEIDDAKKCERGIEVTDGCDGVSRGVGRGMAGVGVTLYVGSLVYDFVSSRREVHEYNRRRRMLLTPVVTADSTGLALSGAF
jgi:hypothetical protein